MAVTAVAGIALLVVAAADEPTHAFELNGDLSDDAGGPALVALGGTIEEDVYVFGPDEGLAIGVDLGTSYSFETRLRIDSRATPDRSMKMLDFRNRTQEYGLFAWSSDPAFTVGGLYFFFTESCDGRVDNAQGCTTLSPNRSSLWSLHDVLPLGTFTTIRLDRDGATNQVRLFVDGDLVTWSTIRDLTGQSEASGSGPARADYIDDFHGSATTGDAGLLHLMVDNGALAVEAASGAVDYVRITLP
ncbi:MAG: hypothetical protein HKN80_02615 [Acidimicrobiia bacterium]|nr:hypothetical protein [Acidimicrobiia bacterium]